MSCTRRSECRVLTSNLSDAPLAGCGIGCLPATFGATSDPVCIGQKQRWFLLRLKRADVEFDFGQTNEPEFDQWRWASVLGARQGSDLLQAPRLYARAPRARADRFPGRAAGVPLLVGGGDRAPQGRVGSRPDRVTEAFAAADAANARQGRQAQAQPRHPPACAHPAHHSDCRRRAHRPVHALRHLRARPLQRRLRPSRRGAAAHGAGGRRSSGSRKPTTSCVPSWPSSTPFASGAHASRRKSRAPSAICRRRSRASRRSSRSTAVSWRRAAAESA